MRFHLQAMTVVIRDFKEFTVAEKHLQVLLGFVEEDIHDHTKQGTAFPLLKVNILSYFVGFLPVNVQTLYSVTS